MATCTPEDVRAINGSTAEDAAIQPFIDAASCLLDSVSACTTVQGITEACLDKACAFLAAHLMAGTAAYSDTGAVKRETFENYNVERAMSGYEGSGVMATPYGQSADELTGGCLQNASRSPAQIGFFG